MGTRSILIAASVLLWLGCIVDAVRTGKALNDETPAHFLAYLIGAAFNAYIASSLWGMA